MKVEIKTVTACAAALFSLNSFACDQHGHTGFVELNNHWIGADEKNNTMTEEKFNEVIDRVNAIYEPVISAKGKTLKWERNWDNGTINAFARQSGNVWTVAMFGGLARHEQVTADAFASVVCHEVGHHIGGAPKKRSFFSTWASNEGQADYFAHAKCMRKFFETENNIELMAEVEVPTIVTEKCEANFNNAEDVAVCQRGSMAGLALGQLLKELRSQTEPVVFETPDQNVATRTNDNHPAPQCRLDTYFQASVCEISKNDDVSETDADLNVCSRTAAHEDGVRPLCWYTPAADVVVEI